MHLNLPAIATEDESWTLSDGRIFTRAKGQPLVPQSDTREQLYARMMDIGAYNFGAQYQQAPFQITNKDEMRGGCFAGADDKLGFPGRWFGRISERDIMAYEVFGIGRQHPARPPERPSKEQFSALMEAAFAGARAAEAVEK